MHKSITAFKNSNRSNEKLDRTPLEKEMDDKHPIAFSRPELNSRLRKSVSAGQLHSSLNEPRAANSTPSLKIPSEYQPEKSLLSIACYNSGIALEKLAKSNSTSFSVSPYDSNSSFYSSTSAISIGFLCKLGVDNQKTLDAKQADSDNDSVNSSPIQDSMSRTETPFQSNFEM